MKHIVFIVGSYYPRFSAVGICAKRVIDALKGQFDISVVAMSDEYAVEPMIRLDGVAIHRVHTPEIVARGQLARRMRASNDLSDRLQLLALRARATLRRLLSPVTVDRALVNAYKRKLEQIPDIDVIVPLVFPFESVIAALEYASSSKVKVVPYLFDNFVDSRSLHVLSMARKLKRRRHLRLEAEMIERSNTVLSMYPLEPHFRTAFSPEKCEKIQFLEHPLLVRVPPARVVATGLVRLVYTGALIRNIREPDYVMDFLEGLDITSPFEADFYVMGNAARQVKSRTTHSGMVIRNRGQVSKEEANTAVEQSSVLLNISEIEGKQISSKIFEYMSAGKPIVHFAYTRDDVVTKILGRYPLALCLLQESSLMDENRANFSRFVSENLGKSMEFDRVAEIFPEALPETTARAITQVILSLPANA